MKVLIAGCGYVGEALGHELLARGDEVIGLRRHAERLPPALSPWAADLEDPASLRGLPGDVNALVFCAGARQRDDTAYASCYVRGLAHLLRALSDAGARLERLVFTSSTAVYEHDDGRWVDEDSPAEPLEPTSRRLLEAEAVARDGAARVTILRLGGIYGPGRASLLRRIARAEVVAPSSARYTNRIHRDDCAGVLTQLLHADDPPPLLLGVDSEPVELGELYRWLADRLGVAAPEVGEATTTHRFMTSKRCRNTRLLETGVALRMPSFRQGYAALMTQDDA